MAKKQAIKQQLSDEYQEDYKKFLYDLFLYSDGKTKKALIDSVNIKNQSEKQIVIFESILNAMAYIPEDPDQNKNEFRLRIKEAIEESFDLLRNKKYSKVPMVNFGALHHKEIKESKIEPIPFTQNEFILKLPNRGELNITRDLFNCEELNKIEDELLEKFPDQTEREQEAKKLYLNRNKIDIALNLQRDLGFTPYEEILFMYCFSIADKDGVFIFNPTEILQDFGKDSTNGGLRQNLAIALYNIMTKRISGKVINYNDKGIATPIVLEMALITSYSATLNEITKSVNNRGFKPAIKTGSVCGIFPAFFNSQKFYYAPLEKRAFQLEPELLFLLRDFIQIARADAENRARLSYLNLIYRLGLATKIKNWKGDLKLITDRLKTLKEKGFIQSYKITKDGGQTTVLDNWFEKETILHKGNLNEALLNEYVITIDLPEPLKKVLLKVKEDQKKKIENQKKRKNSKKKDVITGR